MKVFWQNYHVSVNDGIVNDMLAAGLEVVVPLADFHPNHIGFFAGNDEHFNKPGVIPVTYSYFLTMEPMAIIINCSQLYEDMMKLYRDRGEIDTIVDLCTQMGMGEWLQTKSDYLITHELDWHRKSSAKSKILYFSRPNVRVPRKTDEEIRKSYEEKKVKLYINHFVTSLKFGDNRAYTGELYDANEFKRLWNEKYNWDIPYYGADNPGGYLTQEATQLEIKDSMFTLVFKGHETWGQMVNESMLIGTPCIFLDKYIVDMFTEYLITDDTAIKGKTVEELMDKITNMSFEQYENLVKEAEWASEMFTSAPIRIDKLQWLFSKVKEDLESKND